MSTMTDAQVRAILKEKKAGKVKQESGNGDKKIGDLTRSPTAGIIGRKRQGEDLKQTTLKFVKQPVENKEKKNAAGSDDEVLEVSNVKGKGRWYSHLKAIEFDVMEMEATRERHEMELEGMREKNKDLEMKIKKCAGHDGEITRLKKKNKELEEKLTKVVEEKEEALSNEDTQKRIAASLQNEVDQKERLIKELQVEVADRYDSGFEFALEQVRTVHPNLDLSEVSILKVISDGKLVEATDENVGNVGNDGDLTQSKDVIGAGKEGIKDGESAPQKEGW